jgi:hypothetical protein
MEHGVSVNSNLQNIAARSFSGTTSPPIIKHPAKSLKTWSLRS